MLTLNLGTKRVNSWCQLLSVEAGEMIKKGPQMLSLCNTHTAIERERDENRKELTGTFPMHPRNRPVTSNSTSCHDWKAARMKRAAGEFLLTLNFKHKRVQKTGKVLIRWFIHEDESLSTLSVSLLKNHATESQYYQQNTQHTLVYRTATDKGWGTVRGGVA